MNTVYSFLNYFLIHDVLDHFKVAPNQLHRKWNFLIEATFYKYNHCEEKCTFWRPPTQSFNNTCLLVARINHVELFHCGGKTRIISTTAQVMWHVSTTNEDDSKSCGTQWQRRHLKIFLLPTEMEKDPSGSFKSLMSNSWFSEDKTCYLLSITVTAPEWKKRKRKGKTYSKSSSEILPWCQVVIVDESHVTKTCDSCGQINSTLGERKTISFARIVIRHVFEMSLQLAISCCPCWANKMKSFYLSSSIE